MKRKQSNGGEDCEVKFLGAVQQMHGATASGHMLQPVSVANDKQKKPKASKRKGPVLQNSEPVDGTFMLLIIIIVFELTYLLFGSW